MARRSTIPRLSAAALAAVAVVAGVLIAPPAYAATVTHTIADVQGNAASSPLSGQTVTVEGIVTGDHRTGGVHRALGQCDSRLLRHLCADRRLGRIDGCHSRPLRRHLRLPRRQPRHRHRIGDQVKVTGRVSEFSTVTQINGSAPAAVELVVDGTAASVPAVTPLPATVLGSAREAFEGMLVRPTGTYKLVSSHNLQNFGELWTSAGSAMPVEAFETGAPNTKTAADITTANNNARLILDDGYRIGVGNALHTGDQPYFTKDVVVRNGDNVVFPAGGSLLSFDFNNWRLQPPVPVTDQSPAVLKPTFTTVNSRPATAPVVGGDITVAAFNVLNYFTTLTSQNPDARGASTAEQFAIQKSKIVTAINGLDADVVALQEIENSVKLGEQPDEALADLVAGLNAQAGKGTWAYVRTPAALLNPAITDVITNAIIYKPAVVKPSGEATTVIDETVWGNAREPIAQTFKYGKQFATVISNHFKSKSNNPADPNPQTGQDPYNAARVAQANSLLTFANSLSDGRKNAVYLVGDFNSYAQEDPIKVFTNAGWTDLLFAKAPGQYTYTFDGELGSLDHVIASPAAADKVTKAAVWTINAPEWSGREYWGPAAEAGTPFRSSDHDPIVVGVGSEVVPGTVDIDLVTVNDFHGRIEQAAPAGGIAALSSAVKQIRAANPNTIFAAAGDMIGASTFTSFIQKDVPTIEALNAAGLDVSSVGNHEFDQGFADLTDRVMPLALWEYLGANIYEKGTTTPALPEYYTKTFQGVTIGFVGAVTDELPSLVSPAGIASIDVGDPTEAANRVADQLSDGNAANGEADIVILLVHEGAVTDKIESAVDESTRFGEIVMGVNTNVDAIVSGHTHLAYNHVVTVDGRDMPVISSGQYGERFSRMDIQYDRGSKTFTMKNEIFTMMNGAAAVYPDDPAVAPIVAEAVKVADVLGSVKLGTTTGALGRAVFANPAGATSFPENRGGESTLGNFVADVQKWALNQNTSRPVDIAFMNPGGLRADIDAGEVTYKEAANVQPFANTLVKMDLTAAQIKTVLEQQWQPASASRPFLKLGVNKELTYTYNPTAPAGSRITEILLNGVPLSPTGTYSVGVNSFLAAGGDNFFELANGTNKADSGQVDLEAMVDYFAAAPGQTVSPDLAQRAVGVRVSGDADGFDVGDTVTVNLSSLEFTRDEPAAGTVAISLGATQLGSAPVTRSYTTGTDETGTATVQFIIPAGVTGLTRFAITVPATGTTSSFTITVD